MLGRYVGVRAEIVDLPAFSVHADHERADRLARHRAEQPPETVYVVHGEPEAAAALDDAVADELGWVAVVPRYLERVTLP